MRFKNWPDQWWFRLLAIGLAVVIFFILFGLVSRSAQPLETPAVRVEQFARQQIVDPRLVRIVSSTPTWGNPQAKVVIVEFGDFQCPFCQEEFPVIRSVMEQYRDKIFFIWRQFPITNLHDRALEAAEASVCAQEQGRFWQFHDQLFLNQSDLSSEALLTYAERAGLESTTFIKCMANHNGRAAIVTDVQTGLDNGIKGTPTFFINGTQVSGALPKAFWDRAIELLSAQ